MIDWSLLYLISEWAIRFVMLIYVPQRRSAAASRTWLLFIFLLPWPGVVLYWLFGRIYLPARRVQMQSRASRFIREAQAQIGARITVEPDLPAALQFIPGLAHRLGDFETLAGNRVELLPDYTGTIDRIIGDIDAAQQHVHLLFYIFLADQTGNRVAEALRACFGARGELPGLNGCGWLKSRAAKACAKNAKERCGSAGDVACRFVPAECGAFRSPESPKDRGDRRTRGLYRVPEHRQSRIRERVP